MYNSVTTKYEGIASAVPVAIVGMGCRLPGASSSPSKLWDLLESGQSAQSSVPQSRFTIDAWHHRDRQRPGNVTATGGYFLSHDDNHLRFDPVFFGINHSEAAAVDPQQRKFLEVVYETFESAGVTLEKLSGSRTACYVGCFTSDYKSMQNRDLEYSVPYQMTGSDLTIVSNRINYVFNLKGPSLTVDTACSSSLYALHLACQSLIGGDCEAAVVGGTNIIMGIEQHLGTGRLGVLSPTSTCHTFDESADGFGRADGITALYIKRLSDAVADGDPIRAVIRSTAVNTNGKSAGINHPEIQGQEDVIRQAYARARLGFDETGYFECHGTGTPVGDPIECGAIGNVFAEGRSPDKPLLIGAIKTNVGHTEGASGIASIIKCVLSLEHGVIPATVGVRRLNPKIDFRGDRLRVVCSTMPWPTHLPYLRASVNSFGYGGANAHVILDAAESYLGTSWKAPAITEPMSVPDAHSPRDSNARILNGSCKARLRKNFDNSVDGVEDCFIADEAEKLRGKCLLVFSAHDTPTLFQNVKAILDVQNNYDPLDLAYTLGVRRSQLEQRAFVLSRAGAASPHPDDSEVTYGAVRMPEPTIAFAFTGQGAQWPRMGYLLVLKFPSVRKTFEDLQTALDRLPTPPCWRLLEALSRPPETSKVYDTALSQPLGTAVQIALVNLLASWGIRPQAIAAHSSGEVAAAYAAGLITASEAITVAYCRGVAVAECHTPGAMLAVGLGANQAAQYVKAHSDLVIACQNSPESVTLSGSERAVDEIAVALKEAGIFARKVNSSGNAYHSPFVKTASNYLAERFGPMLPKGAVGSPRIPYIPMYSCVTGELLGPTDVGIQHWLRNLEDPVLFDPALQNLLNTHATINHVLEIGPHSALASPIRQILSALGARGAQVDYLPTLIRSKNGVDDVLRLAGILFTRGYSIDVKSVNAIEVEDVNDPSGFRKVSGKHLVDLPNYQWQYEDIPWAESRISRAIRFRSHSRHDLLGSREPSSSWSLPLWRNMLRLKDVPWISDHKIGSNVLFPAAGYVAMAIEAVSQVAQTRSVVFKEVLIQGLLIASPLILHAETAVETLFTLTATDSTPSHASTRWFVFRVSSVTWDEKCTDHAAGKIAYAIGEIVVKADAKTQHRTSVARHHSERSDRQWYKALLALGLHYGRTFRPLSNICTEEAFDEASAKVALHSTHGTMQKESSYLVHPATIDGCIQLSLIAAAKGNPNNLIKTYLPVEIKRMIVRKHCAKSAYPENAIVHGHGVFHGLRSAHASFTVANEHGDLLAEADVTFSSIEGGFGKLKADRPSQPYSRLVWQRKSPGAESSGNSLTQIAPNGITAVLNEEARPPLWLIFRNQPHPLISDLEFLCREEGIETNRISLTAMPDQIPKGARAIVLAELENPFLARMTQEEHEAVKSLVDTASSAIWITSGGLLTASNPEASLISGLAKVIMTEHPSFRISVIDLDPHDTAYRRSSEIILHHELKWRGNYDPAFETQLSVKDGVLYVSRFIMDELENAKFLQKSNPTPVKGKYQPGLSLDFLQVGQVGSFYFRETRQQSRALHPGHVAIEPRLWSLNKREGSILKGQSDSSFFSHECMGVVFDVSPEVDTLRPGSRVISLTAGKFDSFVVTHQQLCISLHPEEPAETILGYLAPLCIALHTLTDIGRVRSGETVLIHMQLQALAIVTILVARLLGLKVLITYSGPDERELLERDYGILDQELISADPADLSSDLRRSTAGLGVDVVLVISNVGGLAEIWDCLAIDGRFILIDSSAPDMNIFGTSVFSRGVSFATFSLVDMIQSQPQKLARLMQRAVQMLRDGSLERLPSAEIFDIAELGEAVLKITRPEYSGRVMLSCNPESVVPLIPSAGPLIFDAKASYLLIGCLGGLGRSLTSWMASRGARQFIFLSRSGADKPEARILVQELQGSSSQCEDQITVQVVRGDVASREDVDRAISLARAPIRGVIQAAMVLQSHLFCETPLDAFNAVLQPKVQGTINLHEALIDHPLDFFVMTSSAIGILGVATQSAYAAANTFLDNMARHRRSLSLQATTVSLGMIVGIGHIEEFPDIEDALRRYGSYGIDEDEFLSTMELACTRKQIEAAAWGEDDLAQAHIVTGLDFGRGGTLRTGTVGLRWLQDPRLSMLSESLESTSNGEIQGSDDSPSKAYNLLQATIAGGDVEEAKKTLRELVLQKFSKLVQLPAEKLSRTVTKRLVDYGMDSLIGAELRTWAWDELHVDVPFMALLEGTLTIVGLIDLIWQSLDQGLKKE